MVHRRTVGDGDMGRRRHGGAVKMEDLFNTAEAAEYVRLAAITLERMRLSGEGPAFVKLGRSVRYRRIDVDNWIASRVVRSTSEC